MSRKFIHPHSCAEVQPHVCISLPTGPPPSHPAYPYIHRNCRWKHVMAPTYAHYCPRKERSPTEIATLRRPPPPRSRKREAKKGASQSIGSRVLLAGVARSCHARACSLSNRRLEWGGAQPDALRGAVTIHHVSGHEFWRGRGDELRFLQRMCVLNVY